MHLTTHALGVLNNTIGQCEQGVVLATADVYAGVEVGAALTNQDVASLYDFTCELLAAQTLCARVATVASGA